MSAIAAALLVALGAAYLAGWLRVRRRVRAPYTRKVFHFLIFTTAGVLHLHSGLAAVIAFGCGTSALVLYAVVRGDGYPLYEAMARPSDAPRRTLFVLLPLATTIAGGLTVGFLFTPVAHIGYLVSGWGDAVGEPVGTAWGRHRYAVPSLGGIRVTRSLEGSTAVLSVGVLAAFLGLFLYGVEARPALGIALACGAVGAAAEAVSHHGLDNLTVQIAASGTAYVLVGSQAA